jgi:hypothetical protein
MEEKQFAKDLCGVYGMMVHEMTKEELEQYAEKAVRGFLVLDDRDLAETGDERRLGKHLTRRHNPHEGSPLF